MVAKVRGIVRQHTGQRIKIGHTGTLDPAATGLMVLVLGSYTKRAGEFSKLDKSYQAELTLGANSSTGDSEGELRQVSGQKPSKMALQAVLRRFEGQISQTPPIHSAIKIDGQRAYKLARKGLTPDMKPREVTIYSIKLTDYNYPIVKITTEVSSGTYIRSLAQDVGAALGTGAYLSALRRTQVGPYKIEAATTLDKVPQKLYT